MAFQGHSFAPKLFSYLSTHRSDEAKSLAAMHLEIERDQDLRRALEDIINAN